MSIVTELVHMKTKGLIDKENFIRLIYNLENCFHSKQDGFIDTELLYDEKEDIWIMIQHWESLKQMKSSSANMFKDIATEAFRDAIEPKSISIRALPMLWNWSGKDIA